MIVAGCFELFIQVNPKLSMCDIKLHVLEG